MYVGVAYPPFLTGRFGCIGYHVGMAFMIVFVNILFCYIYGVVVIIPCQPTELAGDIEMVCDWNDDVWNENMSRLSLKKTEEIVKSGGKRKMQGCGVSPIGMEGCGID